MKHLFRFRLSRLWLGIACLLALAGSVSAQIQLSNLPENPAPGVSNPSLTGSYVFNGRLYFAATASVAPGLELATTDGTPAGTQLVRNINVGLGQGSDPAGFMEYNGKLYFAATDGSNGRELWVTDGTQAGTQLVKNIALGGANSNPRELAVVNGKLYFLAERPGSQQDLWVSDGTDAGTQRLTDVLGVPTGGVVNQIASVGDKLFYVVGFNDLWVTDGTAAGTRFVKGGPLNSANPMGPRTFIGLSRLTNYDGRLIFQAISPSFGDEPWISDGTPEGTNVIDINARQLDSYPDQFIYYKGLMYFTAREPSRLLATAGTLAGTQVIKAGISAQNLTLFDGKLYFTTNDQELWATNGTEAGTQRVITVTGRLSSVVVSNNKLFFITRPLSGGGDGIFWQSDGTAAGTFPRVGSIVRSVLAPLVNLNDQLIYTGDREGGGRHLYRSVTNATPPGPTVVSFPDRTGTVGQYYFQSINPILPTSGPVSYWMSGLPPGLDFSGGNGGFIGGTPTTTGVYSVTYSVANMFGVITGISYFNFTINPAGGSTALQLLAPTYDCGTGAFTLRTSGGNGTTIEYQIPGVTDWTTNPTGVIPAQIRQDANSMPLLLRARQAGVIASLPFDFNTACVPGAGGLQLLAPTYTCTTGAITFNTSGGDGSPITFTAPGIQRASATSNTGIVEIGLRVDPKPIVIVAMQNGVSASYTFTPVCGGARQAAAEPGNALTVGVLGNPATGEYVEVEIGGATGESVYLSLVNTHGREIAKDVISEATGTERRRLRLDDGAGLYLLRVNTATQSQTVKIIR